jgi:peptidoglycan lytic transglycosylase
MRVLFRAIAVATITVCIGLQAGPVAAQTFDERWSIIPNAHAEPAPPTPPAGPSPATPEQKTPDVQTHAPIKGEPSHSPEEHLATQSSHRVFTGKASFYSYKMGKTASGANFDRNLPTAAHRSLPFGTKVRVTDLATSRSVVVVITDRGPWVRDRVLDISLDAARRLGITDRGVAQVRAEVL